MDLISSAADSNSLRSPSPFAHGTPLEVNEFSNVYATLENTFSL
jgi:hypothetical protein